MTAVETAIKMESDAIKFYQQGAEKTNNPVGKKMFLSIAEDEKRHLKFLTELLKGLDLKIEGSSPIKAVKTIFEDMKDTMMQRLEATQDEMEAFRIAMNMEKEGVEFYKKASSESLTDKERALFQRLVHEEEEHYSIFANTFSFMSDTGNWFMWEEKGIVEG